MQKLKNILLVDDDDITNYINSNLIQELDITEKITVVLNGEEALNYLKEAYNRKSKDHTIPELIFLDINMPVMDGFRFLDEYYYAIGKDNTASIVTMLTTSLIKEEVKKAMTMRHIVKSYIEKPLTKEIVLEIYRNHLSAEKNDKGTPAKLERSGKDMKS